MQVWGVAERVWGGPREADLARDAHAYRLNQILFDDLRHRHAQA